MNNEQLCDCLCGKKSWRAGGGQMGGMSQENFTCEMCGRRGSFLYLGIGALLLPRTHINEGLSEVHRKWVNTSLLPIWQKRRSEVEVIQERLERDRWPMFCGMRGYDPLTPYESAKGLHSEYDEWLAKRPEWRIPLGFERVPCPDVIPKDLTLFLRHEFPGEIEWEKRESSPVRIRRKSFCES